MYFFINLLEHEMWLGLLVEAIEVEQLKENNFNSFFFLYRLD